MKYQEILDRIKILKDLGLKIVIHDKPYEKRLLTRRPQMEDLGEPNTLGIHKLNIYPDISIEKLKNEVEIFEEIHKENLKFKATCEGSDLFKEIKNYLK